jgi:hypothetical protein
VLVGFFFFFFFHNQSGRLFLILHFFLSHKVSISKKLIKKLDPLVINFIIKIIPTFVNVFGYVFGNNCQCV